MFKGVGHQLEFSRILQETASLARSEPAKKEVLSLVPHLQKEKVERELSITETFCKLLSERSIPLESFPDISPVIEKLKVEGVILQVEDFLKLLKFVRQSEVVRKFFYGLEERFSRISYFGERLKNLSELKERLEKSIDESGEVLDSASPKLRSIRRSIRTTAARIREKLESIVNRYESLCPDRIITERDGRYVILVKPAFKSRFKAIVHDRSSSGQTLYVEPLSVVNDNNKLRELRIEEREEIKRILKELSSLAASEREAISESFSALVEIDRRSAVARMSLKLKGTFPSFGDEIELKSARHPLLLLSGKEVIPVDVRLKKGLVITGPNTGGKTVTLKTVGLLSMMAQAGFLIPAEEGSRLRIFKKWMVDIGDEQSIEQSLSTFSAHVKNVARILREADSDSLVLLDELGAGTDPVEGSTLAVGILTYLKGRKAKVIATTHFTPVKLFAYKDDYYDVASVLFDEETLKPLYKLAYGIIGRSYALTIAEKYGMPGEVIDVARSLMSAEDKLAEDIIKALEAEYRRLESERKEVERLKEKLKEKERELKRLEAELKEKESKKILEFIEELKSKAEKVLSEKSSKEARKEIEKIIVTAKNRAEVLKEITPEREVKVGDTVKLLKSGKKGKVVEIDKGRKTAKVLIGNLKVEVKLSQLEPVEELVKKPENLNLSAPKPSRFFPELKLLGMRGEEAISRLEKFLDEANLVGVKRVKIIHGHGTGILKKLVREYLKTSPYVSSFRPGSFEEGGDGVTIVELK